MKMLFTENWFIKAVSASPAKWRRAEKISLIILSSWCLFGSVRAGPQRTTSSSFFCWDRAAFFGQIEGREYLNSINAFWRKCRQSAKMCLVFCQLALFFQSYSITFWGYFITGLHIYRASSASGLLRPFSVKCGAPTQKGEPDQQRSGLACRK